MAETAASKRQVVSSQSGIRSMRSIISTSLLIILVAVVASTFPLRTEIERVERPAPESFSVQEVKRGAQLAAVGDCIVCHTSEAGKPFSGGRPLNTPFGTLYATNLTPDPTTGIGNWSLDAFRRAMREGIGRDGQHLYPALPYEHFNKINDVDLEAVYAFLMTREAVPLKAPKNELIPPLGFRPLLAGWKMLFLDRKPFRPDPQRSAEWNRGAYLVDGLGHCGGCHTPRNPLGAERSRLALAGEIAEEWDAPALDKNNPRANLWNADGMYRYLREGSHPLHGVATGPMGPVAHGLSQAAAEDVRAISIYIDASMHPNGATIHIPAKPAAPSIDRAGDATSKQPVGAVLFAGACASCHSVDSPMTQVGRASLGSLTALQSNSARNAVLAILGGLRTPTNDERPLMPAYETTMTDAQIAAVAAYSRARFTDRPPWKDLEELVQKVRRERTE